MKLILASGSKNRQEILTLARIPFIAIPSDIDESKIKDPDIYKRVVKIAKAKVLKVSEKHKGLILGGDGVNLVDKKVLEKPKSKKQAIQMLKLQSGKICSFLTGFYILNTVTKKSYQGTSETFYKFRSLSENEIKEYVEKEAVLTWAAAFSPANSMAIRFVEWIKGSYTNFNYSVPFEKVIPILQKESIIK
jgi:septum formation protein